MKLMVAAALAALTYVAMASVDDDIAKAIICAGGLIALGIVLSPGERAIYSINTYGTDEENGRGQGG